MPGRAGDGAQWRLVRFFFGAGFDAWDEPARGEAAGALDAMAVGAFVGAVIDGGASEIGAASSVTASLRRRRISTRPMDSLDADAGGVSEVGARVERTLSTTKRTSGRTTDATATIATTRP